MFFEEDNKEDKDINVGSIEAAFEDGDVEVELFEESSSLFFVKEDEDEEDDELDIAFHHDDPRDWY